MGRPKKSEMGPVSTGELILQRALELFAQKGFDAVSVREITRSLGLNEATLYIHYANKSALLDAIFERLEKTLIEPGLRVPPAEFFGGDEGLDVADFLIDGAKRFFSRAGRETRLTWRLLMISQYRHESARRSMEEHLLNAPVGFFAEILKRMQSAGRIRADVNCESAGRIIAATFFDYSFRSNLKAAWNEGHGEVESDRIGDVIDEEFDRLAEELRLVADILRT